MRILFDNCVPAPLQRVLRSHTMTLASEKGWERVQNGRLIALAEEAGFDVLLTTDQNIRYQQNLAGRKLALLVLPTNRWPVVRLHVPEIQTAVNRIQPGEYIQMIW